MAQVQAIDQLPSIEDVYRILRGEDLIRSATYPEATELKGFCFAHVDKSKPSAGYNISKDIWNCYTCGAGGGVYSLIVAAGVATDNRSARAWLREKNLMSVHAGTGRTTWDSADRVYQYKDESGAVLYEVGRWNLVGGGKEFRQRAIGPDGKYRAQLRGIRRVPYYFPEIIAEAAAGDKVLFVVEGEKDCDRLRGLGYCATTNAQGAQWPWPAAWADYFAGFTRAIVIADNDEPGRIGASQRAAIVARTVPDTRLIGALPGVGPKGDTSDFLNAGGTVAQIFEFAEMAPTISPFAQSYPVEAAEKLAKDLTDAGNGEWFNACSGHDYIYVVDAECWMMYKNGVWVSRPNMNAATRAAVDKMRQAAEDYGGEERDAFIEHATESRAAHAQRAMLETAKAEHSITRGDFDKYRTYLNVLNGTLDCETGVLMPHNRQHYLTMQAPVTYDPSATCPNFERWLADCVQGDMALLAWLRMVMGSCLEGSVGQRRLFFLLGPKGTGKSTLLRVLRELMLPYCVTTDFTALSETRNANANGATPALARLKGARLVTASESRDSDKLDAARIKQLIGGDVVMARHLNQENFEFYFEATLILSGNATPRIDADDSLWSKLKVIPFEHQIAVENPNFLEETLLPEMSGILNLALRGLQELRERGYQLDDPDAVKSATTSYRDEEDTLRDFLSKAIIRERGAQVPSDDMWLAYRNWTRVSDTFPLGKRVFAARMRQHGLMQVTSGRERVYAGCSLTAEYVNAVQRE
jgi:putative DNA primase/helicase